MCTHPRVRTQYPNIFYSCLYKWYILYRVNENVTMNIVPLKNDVIIRSCDQNGWINSCTSFILAQFFSPSHNLSNIILFGGWGKSPYRNTGIGLKASKGWGRQVLSEIVVMIFCVFHIITRLYFVTIVLYGDFSRSLNT